MCYGTFSRAAATAHRRKDRPEALPVWLTVSVIAQDDTSPGERPTELACDKFGRMGRLAQHPHVVVFGLATALAILVALGIDQIISSLPFAEQFVSQLEPRHERELDLFVEQSTLITTLATGVFAAIGAILLNSPKRGFRAGERTAFAATVALAGLSLYFGYSAYEEAMWMLRVNTFNLASPPVLWSRRLQFYTFLASALSGLYFVVARVGAGSSS